MAATLLRKTWLHCKNMPMQYTEIFHVIKNEKFQLKKL